VVVITIMLSRSGNNVHAASDAVGLAFLRCGGASPPAGTRSRKTHVTHRRIKIERVYCPYLTATEADVHRCNSVILNNTNGICHVNMHFH
jgi:hypothetical protein